MVENIKAVGAVHSIPSIYFQPWEGGEGTQAFLPKRVPLAPSFRSSSGAPWTFKLFIKERAGSHSRGFPYRNEFHGLVPYL